MEVPNATIARLKLVHNFCLLPLDCTVWLVVSSPILLLQTGDLTLYITLSPRVSSGF